MTKKIIVTLISLAFLLLIATPFVYAQPNLGVNYTTSIELVSGTSGISMVRLFSFLILFIAVIDLILFIAGLVYIIKGFLMARKQDSKQIEKGKRIKKRGKRLIIMVLRTILWVKFAAYTIRRSVAKPNYASAYPPRHKMPGLQFWPISPMNGACEISVYSNIPISWGLKPKNIALAFYAWAGKADYLRLPTKLSEEPLL